MDATSDDEAPEAPPPPSPAAGPDRIRIGVSQCLIGDEVRFDASHKRDRYLTDVLGAYFDWEPVCPEVGIGMGVPRPPIHLVQVADPTGGTQVRAVGVRVKDLDVTEGLNGYFEQVRGRLVGISGFVLKRASPSCGMERVKVYGDTGYAADHGPGLFAGALMRAWPTLPVEEEGRLNDPLLRENFITRVFAYRRWQDFVAGRAGPVDVAGLQNFHADHKLLVMAHHQVGYRNLGRLVAEARRETLPETLCAYEGQLMASLARRASPRQHSNALEHLLGYLKRHLDAEDKAEMVGLIDRYRRGELPLVVPLTLMAHHFRRHPHPYVERQLYLRPHPAELMLRNRV